jgi:hypothetical protein
MRFFAWSRFSFTVVYFWIYLSLSSRNTEKMSKRFFFVVSFFREFPISLGRFIDARKNYLHIKPCRLNYSRVTQLCNYLKRSFHKFRRRIRLCIIIFLNHDCHFCRRYVFMQVYINLIIVIILFSFAGPNLCSTDLYCWMVGLVTTPFPRFWSAQMKLILQPSAVVTS